MRLTGRFSVTDLDEDQVSDLRSQGYSDTAIIHKIEAEIKHKEPAVITELSDLEFYDCEIKVDKEPSLPF